MKSRSFLFIAAAAAAFAPTIRAWDYEGHRMVNGVALAALPKEFPAFVRLPANAERVMFLAGEPDRWRNVPDLPLQQANAMDHYLDLEHVTELGLDLAKLPSFRYDFATQFAAARATHAAALPAIDPAKNRDHTREWAGFLPWAIAEHFAKLRSGFSYLRVYEELGTPEEIANAQANILYIMGVMGHYVGDGAQPLHVTVHHHGWVGPNPEGYSTWYGIHQWVDGGFIAKSGIKLPDLLSQVETSLALPVAPRPDGRDPVFVAAMDYLQETFKHMEPLYRLEKEGKLGRDALTDRNGTTVAAQPVLPETRKFIEHRLIAGGEMLASLWVTAWRTSVRDTFLEKSLAMRKAARNSVPVTAPANAIP